MNLGRIGLLVAIGLMTVFASGTASASTVGAVVGVGTATFAGCPQDSDLIIPIVGANAAGTWVFVVGDFNLGLVGCAIASAEVFSGTTYTVADGGCLPGVISPFDFLCLGGFAGPGPGTVSLDMCQVIAGCVTGTATLVGVEA